MHTIARQLKENNLKKIVIMVPEQATFCYQYELINQYGLSGVLTLEILSFQRMARTVMRQCGGLARQSIDDLGKLLVLRRLLQEEESKYPYFGQSINRPGYLMKLGETIQELKRYQISSDLLQHSVTDAQLPKTLFSSKLQELSQLYSGYDAFLSQDYLDSEDVLDVLLQQLQHTELFADTEIWVDEFYDFTPQEFAILGALMQCAKQVYIVLPIDSQTNNLGRKAVFHNTTKTLDKLRTIAMEQAVEIVPDIICHEPLRWQNENTQHRDLLFLEQQYFNLGNVVYDKTPEQFALIQGQNRLSEVDFAARTIRQLCREKGYRYNDIGIFTRGDQYELLLETTLSDYDIPYFIDHKEAVHQHLLTELILAAFEIVHNRWNYQSMFRFLKNDLLPFPRNQIDMLENYVLQYGIRSSAWYRKEHWHYGAEQYADDVRESFFTELNELRESIAGPLYALQQTVSEPSTADEMVRALYALLEAYHVPEQLEQLCKDALADNLMEEAQVHQQIWDKMIHIFDQMSTLLQDTPLTSEAFAAILQSAVQNLDLGLLPTSLDQVFVGALSHSRTRNLKVVFVLGLNEGVFPAKATQDGFFNDMEKQLLRDMGLTLSPDSGEQIYDEQFLIYLALTRASDLLYMSYSLCDEEGKALRPSTIADRLHRIMPQLQVQAVQWPPDDTQSLLPYLNHPNKALGLLGSHLAAEVNERDGKSESRVWQDLYQWFDHHSTPLFERVQQSIAHEEQLDYCNLESTQLFGSPLRLSVSALEKYRQCPYGYFLQYGLRLQERKLYQVEAVDTGQFYHTAIEQFSNYLLEQNISWKSLDAKKVKQIMADIVERLAPSMQNEILMSTGRYQYVRRRLQKTLERSALLLMEHGQKGDFMPVALEADFGMPGSKLPAWKITLQDGTTMQLQGIIDRIEYAADARGKQYLRVIDFKSGKQGLDLAAVYYGLKIQLLTYLQVALMYYDRLLPKGQQILPAGVLYYYFRSGIVPVDGPISAVEAEQLHLTDMRADGLLLADMHALKLAERELKTGSSTLLPLSLLTKAAPYIDDPDSFDTLDEPMELFGKRNNTVVSKEQLELLLYHVQQLIGALGEEIHRGNIAIRPCRIRQFTGCKYCKYHAICQIQTVDFMKHSEELPTLTRDEVWSRLEAEHHA